MLQSNNGSNLAAAPSHRASSRPTEVVGSLPCSFLCLIAELASSLGTQPHRHPRSSRRKRGYREHVSESVQRFKPGGAIDGFVDLMLKHGEVAIEIICVALQTIVYSLLLYSIIGMMVVVPTPGHQIVAIVMSFLNFLDLILQFPPSASLHPGVVEMVLLCTPVVWPIYDIFTSLYGNKMNDMDIEPEPSMALNAFLNKYVVFPHIGFVLIFFFVFATASSGAIQSSDSM